VTEEGTLYTYVGAYADIVSCWKIRVGSNMLLYGNTASGGYVHLNTLYSWELAFGKTFAEMGEMI
jgi:hypothetical protein